MKRQSSTDVYSIPVIPQVKRKKTISQTSSGASSRKRMASSSVGIKSTGASTLVSSVVKREQIRPTTPIEFKIIVDGLDHAKTSGNIISEVPIIERHVAVEVPPMSTLQNCSRQLGISVEIMADPVEAEVAVVEELERSLSQPIAYDVFLPPAVESTKPKRKYQKKKKVDGDAPTKKKVGDTVASKYSTEESLLMIGISVMQEVKTLDGNYGAYSNRGGPVNFGMKEKPIIRPGALDSFVFALTGVLDSLEKSEVESYIKGCGGAVCSSTKIAKKVTHALVGIDAGKSKIAQINERGIPKIDEDGLIKLVEFLHHEKNPGDPTSVVEDSNVKQSKGYESDEAFDIDDESE